MVPGTGKCFQYDSRYQAASLEEALISFPDLTIENPPDPVDELSVPIYSNGKGLHVRSLCSY